MNEVKLYVYTRKSKDEEGHSIDMQLAAAENVKNDYNFTEIVHLNEGQGVSGAISLYEREKANELMGLLERGECKHLFLYEWSRIARDSFQLVLFKKTLKDNNVFVYLNENKGKPIDLNNEDDQLLSDLLGAVAVHERSKLKRRIKDSLKQSRKAGKWSGILPYAYKRNNDNSVGINEVEFENYKQMVSMVKKGNSLRQISNWLNDNDIPTKRQTDHKSPVTRYKDKILKKVVTKHVSELIWKDKTVWGILTNKLYKGIRIDIEGVIHNWLPLITEQEWDELQVKLEENISRHRNGNKQVHQYLLKNLIYCGKHNVKFLGKMKKDEQTYYCNKKRKEIRLKTEPPCSIRSLNLPKFESFIWNTLIDVLKQSNSYKEIYKSQKLNDKTRNKLIAKCQNDLDKLQKDLDQKVKSKLKMQYDYYEKGNLDEHSFQNLTSTFTNQISELEFEVSKRRIELNSLESQLSQQWIDWYKDFHIEVESWRNSDDFQFKREKVNEYIDSIWVKDFDSTTNIHKIEIYFKQQFFDELTYNSSNKKDGYEIKQLTNNKLYDFNNKIFLQKPHIKLPLHLKLYIDMRYI